MIAPRSSSLAPRTSMKLRHELVGDHTALIALVHALPLVDDDRFAKVVGHSATDSTCNGAEPAWGVVKQHDLVACQAQSPELRRLGTRLAHPDDAVNGLF